MTDQMPICNDNDKLRAPHWTIRWIDQNRFIAQVEYDVNIGDEINVKPQPAYGARVLCTCRRNETPNTIKMVVIVSTSNSLDPSGDIDAVKQFIQIKLGLSQSDIYVLGEDITIEEWQPGYTSAVPAERDPGSIIFSPPH